MTQIRNGSVANGAIDRRSHARTSMYYYSLLRIIIQEVIRAVKFACIVPYISTTYMELSRGDPPRRTKRLAIDSRCEARILASPVRSRVFAVETPLCILATLFMAVYNLFRLL